MEERVVPRPNIVFVLADQHGHKVMGHTGNPDVQTPNLDRLAADGVRFTNAVTQNPICTPSRICWLSGQYCHNHGYYGLSGPNPNGLPTVLGHFRRHGYRTAAIGKIHCPEYWVEDDSDVYHETVHCSIGGRSPDYTAFLVEQEVEHLEDHEGFPEFGRQGRQKLDARPSGVSYEQSQEAWAVCQALDFARTSAGDNQPFIAHVSLPKPHQCYAPAQEFWDLYDEESLTLPPNADIDLAAAGKAPHLIDTANSHREGWAAIFEPKTYEAVRRRKLRGYLGNVSHVDHAMGQLLDGLDAAGLGENTIVIYSADHGEYATEFGLLEKAPGICSDAVCRIPWLWRWPAGGIAGGRVQDELVETVDLANTLCALAELPAMETADGRNLDELLRGRGAPLRDTALTEFAFSKAIYDGRYRLVYYPPGFFAEYPDGFRELYDLQDDPWEMTNRWSDPALADVRARLEQRLLDRLVLSTRPATALPHARWESPQWKTRYSNAVNADGKVPPARLLERRQRNYL
jgi:choline-sulfatase/uncharacterized sulfatase